MEESLKQMPTPKKARVRKTAPTVRQRVETAKIKAEEPEKSGRVRRSARLASKPLKKLRLPSNPVSRGLIRVLRFLVPRYFVNSWREVKLVEWPSRRDTWRLTGAVFLFAVIFGALVAGVDKVLDIIFKNLVLK